MIITRINKNYAFPILESVLDDREFTYWYPLIGDILRKAVKNEHLPKTRHPNDRLILNEHTAIIIFVWNNLAAAQQFVELINCHKPSGFINAVVNHT